MLEEFIRAYEEAEREGKKSVMMKIERQLQSIGMDRASLLAIVEERKKEGRR